MADDEATQLLLEGMFDLKIKVSEIHAAVVEYDDEDEDGEEEEEEDS